MSFSLVPTFISEWYVSTYGKFHKPDVFYTPPNINPPPVAWIYQCKYCKYYQPSSEDPNRGLCALVSETGPPTPGEIAATSWCILWTSRPDNPPFSWLLQIIPK